MLIFFEMTIGRDFDDEFKGSRHFILKNIDF